MVQWVQNGWTQRVVIHNIDIGCTVPILLVVELALSNAFKKCPPVGVL